MDFLKTKSCDTLSQLYWVKVIFWYGKPAAAVFFSDVSAEKHMRSFKQKYRTDTGTPPQSITNYFSIIPHFYLNFKCFPKKKYIL